MAFIFIEVFFAARSPAFLKTLRIPSDVESREPWCRNSKSCGSCLKNASAESSPRRLEAMIFIERLFEQPGLPTRKTGMRFIMQTSRTKVFSSSAPFLAVPSGSDMRSM